MQEKPDPELLDALKASLGQRYAGMKDAPWFKEAHEGKPLGEGAQVDSVEPPASPACGHEFDRGRCIHCGTKRPLCEKCKAEAVRTPRWMAAPECTHAASQEGPSEGEHVLRMFNRDSLTRILDPDDRKLMVRLIDSALSSKGVAVRDEALEEAARIAENVRGGFTANIRADESEQEMVRDVGGPWVLNSDVATAIRRALKGGKP